MALFKGLIATASLATLLAGCGAPPKFDWVKEGTSKYERDTVLSECNYQVKLNKTSAAEQGELIRLCMQGKGFRYKQLGS